MGIHCFNTRLRHANNFDNGFERAHSNKDNYNCNFNHSNKLVLRPNHAPTWQQRGESSSNAAAIADYRSDDEDNTEAITHFPEDASTRDKQRVVEEPSSPPSFVEEQEQPSLISVISTSGLYSDVWYRRFLKPLTRKHRPVPYRDSFQRRVLQPIGIPVAQLNCGLHGIFRRPEYVQYSPLIGMLFTYNNFIDNLYRYGDDDGAKEPAVSLIRMLFYALPGGDIQTTHLGSCAGAHLTPSIIGRVFEAWEATKPDMMKTTNSIGNDDWAAVLVERFLPLIVDHPDYQEGIRNLREDVTKAESGLQALIRRDQESQPVRDRIKALEGDVIKKGRHRIKRARKELLKLRKQQQTAARNAERQKAVEEDIAEQEHAMQVAATEVEQLRLQIVTSADFKSARKAVRRAHDMVDEERGSRLALVESLVRSFLGYDLPLSSLPSSATDTLPRYTTTAILLAYIWRKYDGIAYLEGYFESMERMNAISVSAETVKATRKEQCVANTLAVPQETAPDLSTSRLECPSLASTCPTKTSRKWNANDIAAAASIVTTKPGLARRPPTVPFSYITWARYSEFPDCGENALRNLINQMLYNPKTNLFDHELLEELREQYYPRLKQKLIAFYKRNSIPRDATDYSVAKDWIEVCSKLNQGLKKTESIRYRREKQQQNIASPLSNVLRAVNVLFGIKPTDSFGLEELASSINKLRDWNLQLDTAGIENDGFGVLGLSDGKVRYELQSYKPVHFGFVQVETLDLDTVGRRDYEVFRELKNICNSRQAARLSHDDPVYLEQLGLASLFVPYDFDRRKRGRFFAKCPPHYRVLFAELHGLSQQENVLQWATRRHADDPTVMSLVNRVLNYTEPSFVPISPASSQSSEF